MPNTSKGYPYPAATDPVAGGAAAISGARNRNRQPMHIRRRNIITVTQSQRALTDNGGDTWTAVVSGSNRRLHHDAQNLYVAAGPVTYSCAINFCVKTPAPISNQPERY